MAVAPEHKAFAIAALQWLAFSARPLKMEELSEAAIIDPSTSPAFEKRKRLNGPNDVLEFLPGLLTVSYEEEDLDDPDNETHDHRDQKERGVQLLHSLVWRESDRGPLSSGVAVDHEQELHRESLRAATEVEENGNEQPDYQASHKIVSPFPFDDRSIARGT